MKKVLSVLLACVLISAMVGCAASAPKDPNLDYNGNYGSSTDSIVGGNGIFGESSTDKNNPEYGYDEKPSEGENGENAGEYLERKVVYTVTTEIQTKAFEDAMNIINSSISKHGGYIQSQTQKNNGSINSAYAHRSVTMVVRIPSKNLDAFLSELRNDCMYIISLSKDSKDYSSAYYDKEIRIESLKVQEERLLEMLRKADDLKTMLELEDRLSNIRYQIESLTKEMNIIDSNVDYSTVTIRMNEVVEYVEAPVTFGDRVKMALGNTWKNVVNFAQDAVVWFIYAAPTLIIFAILGSAGTIIAKVKIKQKKLRTKIAQVHNETDGKNKDESNKK